MIKTASISELRERLANYIDNLDKEGPVMVVRNSKPAGYLVAAQEFEYLLRCLEDYEDLKDSQPLWKEAKQGKNTLPANEVRKRLNL
jgi:prevent-host-death family protein